MSLTGSTNAEKIWNYLYKNIGNAYGVAGVMGNLYYESALNPKNLQNSYEKSLGYTDETYTDAVDDGSYTEFASDGAGYGLVQWTYSTRKQAMYDYIVGSLGKSIGDLESQLAFLIKEIKTYTAVWTTITTAASVKEASDKVLTDYENPANQSATVKKKRAAKGEEYYEKYAETSAEDTATTTSTSTSSSSGIVAGMKLTLKNTPLYISSTAKTKSATKTGTYYLWDATEVSGRYRITNSTSNVGKSGKVTGWVDSEYITGTTSTTSSVAAGDKLTLKKCPLYATATTTTKSNTLTGTYYLWSATKTSGRYMITNKKANVGKSNQVTGWISSDYVE